jgi:hypothetical protein
MPYAKPIVGIDATVELTPTGGGSSIIIKNSKYKITPKSMIKEAPNTTDGMLRATGLTDYSGSVEGHTDATSSATAVDAQVMPGDIFDAKFYRSKNSNLYWAGRIIVGEDLSIESGVDQTEDWSFSFAKQSGPLITPGGRSF